MKKQTARRLLFVLSAWLLFGGLVCLSQAQVPMTGAGKGAPTVSVSSVTVDPAFPNGGTTKYQLASNSFSDTGMTVSGGLTNPALVCMVIRATAALDITTGAALTWDGASMTLIKAQASGASTQNGVFLFGLRNPASGNKTLAFSATNIATDNFINCVSFSNVNQTSDALAFPNPVGDTVVATVSVTSASGHVAVGVFDNGSSNGTIIGTTVINNNTDGSIINVAGDYVVSSGISTVVGTTTAQINIAGTDVSN